MDRRVAFVTGIGLGAGAMFLLDPDRGRRRRALIRDKAVNLSNTGKDALDKTARDLRNRATGVIAETKARLSQGHVPDEVLVDRVKAAMGRYPVHDRAVYVEADNGIVILNGDTLVDELGIILEATSAVRGVKEVVNNLNVHPTAGGISSLQGTPAGTETASWH
ncbi:MAG TPA: BON domain-containing protein [Pyrinomonadaceae bacterium]